MLLRLAFCVLDAGRHHHQKLNPQGCDTYRLRSSSSLMMHAAPVRLHWAHSDSPSLTTQRILRSRHEAHAIEARWRICCLADERLDGAGLEAFSDCSDPALSLSPSERDLLFVPAMVASAVAAAMRPSLVDAVGVPVFFLSLRWSTDGGYQVTNLQAALVWWCPKRDGWGL